MASIPLFRSIKQTNYDLYLGLPFQTSFEKLQNRHNNQELILNETDDKSYSYQQYQTDSSYITTLIRKEKNGTIYIVVSTKDKETAQNNFTYEKLNQRILIEE